MSGMAKSQVIDKDKGYRALKRTMLEAREIAVKVGIIGEPKKYDPSQTRTGKQELANRIREEIDRRVQLLPKVLSRKSLAAERRLISREIKPKLKAEAAAAPAPTIPQIAHWNEFGTKRAPSRPAFRNSVDRNREKITEAISRIAAGIVDGRDTLSSGTKKLGLFGQALVRDEITILDHPPNAEYTIKKKGSSNPLIDTGQLRKAVSFEVIRGDAVRVARAGLNQGGKTSGGTKK